MGSLEIICGKTVVILPPEKLSAIWMILKTWKKIQPALAQIQGLIVDVCYSQCNLWAVGIDLFRKSGFLSKKIILKWKECPTERLFVEEFVIFSFVFI